MSDPEPVFDDVDPEEWKRNLEYALKHEYLNCPLADKIQFVKKMADSLKLTLDDIRGKNESAKYCALNSIPPDVIPIDIKLTDGHRIVLMMVNPVATCYEDFLTDVRGDIVHIFVRRKGEELPEDFLPPNIIMNVSPPPPGFVRSSVFRRRVVIPSVDRNEAAEPRLCQLELRPGTSEPGPSTSEPRPSTSEPRPSNSELGLITTQNSLDVNSISELDPFTSQLGHNSSNEMVTLVDEKYKEESTYNVTEDKHSSTDEVLVEEVAHNVIIEYNSTDKQHEESLPNTRKEETPTSEKNQEKSVPIISYGEDTPIDEDYKKDLTLDMCDTSDEEQQKESIVDTSEEDDTPGSKENDSPYDGKDLDESIPSTLDVSIPSTIDISVSIPSTADDLSETKSIDLEMYPCIEIDSLSSNSMDFSNKIQVVGLVDPDIITEMEPEVEPQVEESCNVESNDVIIVPQDNEDLLCTSSPVKRKRGRPRKCDRNSVAHSTGTEDQVNTSLRRIKTRLSSRGNRGKTSGTFLNQSSDKKKTSLFKNKKLMARRN